MLGAVFGMSITLMSILVARFSFFRYWDRVKKKGGGGGGGKRTK